TATRQRWRVFIGLEAACVACISFRRSAYALGLAFHWPLSFHRCEDIGGRAQLLRHLRPNKKPPVCAYRMAHPPEFESDEYPFSRLPSIPLAGSFPSIRRH